MNAAEEKVRLYDYVYVAVDKEYGTEEEFSTAKKASAASGAPLHKVLAGEEHSWVRWEKRAVLYGVTLKNGQTTVCRYDAQQKLLIPVEGGPGLNRAWCKSIRRIGSERVSH